MKNCYMTIYEIPEKTKEEKFIKENAYKFISLQNTVFYMMRLLKYFKLLLTNNKNKTINQI